MRFKQKICASDLKLELTWFSRRAILNKRAVVRNETAGDGGIIVRLIGRKGKRTAALLLAGVLAAALLPGNIRAEEAYSAGDEPQTAVESEAAGGISADIAENDNLSGQSIGKTGEDPVREAAAQEEAPVQEEMTAQENEPAQGVDPVQEEITAQENEPAQRVDPVREEITAQENEPAQEEDQEAEEQQIWQITDPASGVSAEADVSVIPQGTAMLVTPLESGQSYEMLKMLLSMTADRFRVYDIRFFDMAGNAVQPGGSVKISVPIPDGYAPDRLAVYHISMEGKRTELAFTAVNGSAVFETAQFSLFAIVEKKKDAGAQTDLPSSLAPTEKIPRLELDKASAGTAGSAARAAFSKNPASPATGDGQELMRWAALAVLTGAAAAALGRRRSPVAEPASKNTSKRL